MTEKSAKISVIVAVYKAEKYLYRCLDSLLAQTFREFEVLLIDDGSPDMCGLICDDYAQKDRRIRVFHKSNEGISATRQFGIEHATGTYSIHVDSDDWVEPTMLEDLYRKAIQEDADMVFCDFFVDKNGKSTYRSQQQSSLDRAYLLKRLFYDLHGSCCNKLIRTSCFAEYDIRFPQGLNYCEDFMVVLELLQNPIRIDYLHHAFYHYYSNPTSITLTKADRHFLDQLFLWESLVEQKLKDEVLYRDEIILLKCRIKKSAFLSGVYSTKDYNAVYPEINSYLKNIHDKFITDRLVYFSTFLNYRVMYALYKLFYSIYLTCYKPLFHPL